MILLVVISVILVLVIYFICVKLRTSYAYCNLPGFYKGDPGFCHNAELKSISLLLKEPESIFDNTYQGYLLMEANQGIIANEPVKVRIVERWDKPKNWSPLTLGSFTKYYTLSFIDMQSEVMPSRLEMEFDVKTGKMQLYDKDKLRARMYKDNQLTELCNNVDSAECKKLKASKKT